MHRSIVAGMAVGIVVEGVYVLTGLCRRNWRKVEIGGGLHIFLSCVGIASALRILMILFAEFLPPEYQPRTHYEFEGEDPVYFGAGALALIGVSGQLVVREFRAVWRRDED